MTFDYLKYLQDPRYQNISEAQTIEYLIAPIFETYTDWSRRTDFVQVQWRHMNEGKKENPVDFAFFHPSDLNKPVLLLEAKKLFLPLTATEKMQTLKYAYVAGVQWCLLTNGIEWLLYDSFNMSTQLEEKLVFSIHLNRDDPRALSLINIDQILGLGQFFQKEKDKQKIKQYLEKLDLNEMIEMISKRLQMNDSQLIRDVIEQDYPNMKLVGISNHDDFLPSVNQVDLLTHNDWTFSEPIAFEIIFPSHERHCITLERKKWVDCLIAFINFFIDYNEYDLFKKYDHLLKLENSDFKANSKQIYALKRGFINTHSSTVEKIRIMRSIAHLYQVQVFIELQFAVKHD